MAKKEKSGIEHGERSFRAVFGRLVPEFYKNDHVFPRAEWDTPINYDEARPPGNSFTLYNYRLGRSEWSFQRLSTQPREIQKDYYPPGRAPWDSPDARKAITPDTIALVRTVTVDPPYQYQQQDRDPVRRFVLPPIDNRR